MKNLEEFKTVLNALNIKYSGISLTLPERKCDMTNYDYEADVIKVDFHDITISDNLEPMTLEIIHSDTNEQKFQLWYDANPLMYGCYKTLTPDYMPLDVLLTKKFIKDFDATIKRIIKSY